MFKEATLFTKRKFKSDYENKSTKLWAIHKSPPALFVALILIQTIMLFI